MSDTGNIPAAMVEAAVRVLSLSDTVYRSYHDHVRAALAAAFAECEAVALDDVVAAARRVTSAVIAVCDRLDTPYTDAPEWTPWTRFVSPALTELDFAVKALRDKIGRRGCGYPSTGGDGDQQ